MHFELKLKTQKKRWGWGMIRKMLEITRLWNLERQAHRKRSHQSGVSSFGAYECWQARRLPWLNVQGQYH